MIELKKIISVVLTVIIISGSVLSYDCKPVYAYTKTQDHGFNIDENLFNVYWNETSKIYVNQEVPAYDVNFVTGTRLGYVKVYAGFATTKQPVDGKYYQRILVRAEMVPQSVSTNKMGMSQYLTVKILNPNGLLNTRIEPASSTGETSYSTTGSIGVGLSLGVSKKNSGLTANGGFDFNMGISATSSYVEDSLNIITNKDASGWATWNYDYVSSGSNAAQNAYLFGSSTQFGLFSWNIEKGSTAKCIKLPIYVVATFGGGNKATNNRAKAMYTFAHNLGDNAATIWVYAGEQYK